MNGATNHASENRTARTVGTDQFSIWFVNFWGLIVVGFSVVGQVLGRPATDRTESTTFFLMIGWFVMSMIFARVHARNADLERRLAILEESRIQR